MKKITLFFAILLIAVVVARGQRATASCRVFAEVIDLDDFLKKHNLSAGSMEEKLHKYDSTRKEEQARFVLNISPMKIGSTTAQVREIWGNDYQNVPILNPNQKKWEYPDSTVFFTDGLVTTIIPSKKEKIK